MSRARELKPVVAPDAAEQPLAAARPLPRVARPFPRGRDLALHLPLLLLLALTFYPFVFLVQTSLKDNSQFYHDFWGFGPPFHWGNYVEAWGAIAHYVANTVVVTVATVAGTLAVASLAAYVFARHRFPGKEVIYVVILALLMVPGILTLIPAFVLVSQLGLLNTPWALILPWTAGGQIFGILLCRSFFATLPQELFDAAKVDGASELEQYYRIAMPLSCWLAAWRPSLRLLFVVPVATLVAAVVCVLVLIRISGPFPPGGSS